MASAMPRGASDFARTSPRLVSTRGTTRVRSDCCHRRTGRRSRHVRATDPRPPMKRSKLEIWRCHRGGLPWRRKHEPEEIVVKLRQVHVLTSEGMPPADAILSIGVTHATYRGRNARRPEVGPSEAAAEGSGDRERAAQRQPRRRLGATVLGVIFARSSLPLVRISQRRPIRASP